MSKRGGCVGDEHMMAFSNELVMIDFVVLINTALRTSSVALMKHPPQTKPL
jgi:hypothetical protein